MSGLVAGVAPRVGSSFQHDILKLGHSTRHPLRRYASVQKGGAKGPQSTGGKKVQRDERGNIIRAQKDKSLGLFRPLPAGSLTDPLFQAGAETSLKLPSFHPGTVVKANIGKAAEFSIVKNDPIKVYGLPKLTHKEFRLLSKPCSIIRDATVDVAKMLESAKSMGSRGTLRVFTGSAGCGKSYLLLQSVKHCLADNWIVIYIPQAVNLVNSTTNYIYDLRTETYLQPAYSYQILQRLLSVNQAILSSLNIKKEWALEKRTVPAGGPLVDLINIGVKDKNLAPFVLDSVMGELGRQTEHPVLLAVDDFQSLFSRSAYRDPHFQRIRAFHLSLPRLILEFASGRRKFARGAFLGALSSSNTQYPAPTELKDHLDLYPGLPDSPYVKRSKTLQGYMAAELKAYPVPEKFSVNEAASLFEVWMQDKAIAPTAKDELFLSKYTESSGNPRDFVWKGLLSTLEA